MNGLTLIQISDHGPTRRGGFHCYTYALAKRIQGLGGTCELVYFGEPAAWFRDWMAEAGARTHGLPNIWTEPERPWTIARAIRRIRAPDRSTLVHAHFPIFNGICLALRCRGYRHIVLSDRLSGTARRMPYLLRLAKNLTNRFQVFPASAIIAISSHVRRRLAEIGIPYARTRLLHNTVDPAEYDIAPAARKAELRREFGLAQTDCVACYTGRLIPEKGVDVFLRAIVPLRREFPHLHVLIAGDGEAESSIREFARALELDPVVRFLGRVPSTVPVLQASDVLVCPSVWAEGFGYVNIEAMATGLPVVAAGVGGIVDIVEDGVTGFLVPPADTGAITAALRRLLADEPLRKRMGAAGRKRVETHFNLETTLDTTLALYADILGATNSRRVR
ncbi:MAG: glycosyltransferase family 4 protein [Kiritimatiellae bacterium]|nr:glycosyltransferase family 4 protein [Kiritimatiellia bacterium]